MNYLINYGLLILGTLITLGAQAFIKIAYNKYKKVRNESGIKGSEMARYILDKHNMSNVKVVKVSGELTDHYDPTSKVVRLSESIYDSNTIAAIAVAAHECGHAVQHATMYSWLQMRSNLVPVVSFASKWVTWLLLGGMLLLRTFPQLLLAGIVLFALTTLFSFVTLPVEINASKRALVWLDRSGITSPETHPKAQRALKLAAYTYVIAALSSLATLLYYVMIYLGASRRD